MSRIGDLAKGDPERVPPEIDTSVPHSARVYDYLLGGKDNYAVDRAAGDAVAEHVPNIRIMMRANRAFLGRAVRYLVAEAGIRQFLDIGTGIPTANNVHDAAQVIAPETRVLYVDNDPMVLAHARALMTSTPEGRTAFIFADLRRPREILDDPALAATLDLSKPVALMLVSILHNVPAENDELYACVATLVDALPSGSYLTISHATADFVDPKVAAGGLTVAQQTGASFGALRSRAEIERFFTGLELVEPGLVPLPAWRPEGEPPADLHDVGYWAAVGRKP